MIKSVSRRAVLSVIGALILNMGAANAQPQSAPPKVVPKIATRKGAPIKITPIAAPAYRAKLQGALETLKTRRRDTAIKVIRSLDGSYDVRRADGETQKVTGNFWSNFGRDLNPSKQMTPSEIKPARQALELQLRALDEWTKTPFYQPVDAKKIVAQLETSGQIRTGPLWWQKAISDAWSAIKAAWTAFRDWLNGLLPRPASFQTTSAPSDKWLWALFYGLVAAILAAVLWFLWRTFGGNLRRRAVKSAAEMQNEDAQLLQLPPEELLSRAERFAAQGNFREALRHRYLSLLLDLDARGVWRYDARRTNWEHISHLSRVESRRELVAPLSDLTKRFDRVRYGGAACDENDWRSYHADARGFETQAMTPKSGAPETPREMEMAR